MWPLHKLPGVVKSQLKTPGRGLSEMLARRASDDADVVVATFEELMAFGFDSLSGTTVVSSSISDERLAVLQELDVDMVLDATPQPFEETINAGTLQAMMMALAGGASGRLTNDDLLDMIVDAGLTPRVLYPNGFRRKSRFAFVIHPLSQGSSAPWSRWAPSRRSPRSR